MKNTRAVFLLAVCLLVASAASGNNYPYPGKATPVPCTGCPDPNTDLPTWPYDDPIVDHAGRYVDSTRTANIQHAGMRTVRARKVRVSPATGRLYLQLGETVGGYALDQFFTTTLRQPMVPVNVMATGAPYNRFGYPMEKVADPGSFLYPEASSSGWITYLYDAQVTLYDFDADDRGYVYASTIYWGWGIGRDVDVPARKHMTFISQVSDPGIDPLTIFSLRTGDQYFAVISNGASTSSASTKIYEVTAPASPVLQTTRPGSTHSIRQWARYDADQRLAVINGDGNLRIYHYAAFLAGAGPLTVLSPSTASKSINGMAFDEDGTLWFAEANKTGLPGAELLRKATPGGGGYTATTVDVYGSAFRPHAITAGAGYLAVIGRNGQNVPELRLFRLTQGTPVLLDIDEFFTRYYHSAPAGYASPSAFTPSYTQQSAIQLFEQADKTYLFYSAEGLGDVYELERTTVAEERIGTSIALTSSPNPSSGSQSVTLTATLTADSTGAGPPVGVVTFTKNGVAYGTAALVSAGTNTWIAMLTRTDLNLGQHELTASFEGDDTYAPSGPAEHTHQGAIVAPVISASATSTSNVTVTWVPQDGVPYDVLRRDSIGGAFTVRGRVTGGTFNDGGVAAGATYVYKVQAILPDDTGGPISNLDVATTVAFSNAGLPTGTAVKAAHFTELRNAVQAVRTAAGLGAATFTDPSLTAGMIVKALHYTELRTAANEARTALGLSTVPNAAVTPQVTTVKRTDVIGLREAVN